MITPEISWLSIFPEILLAAGAAGVLLVDVQWKPPTAALGAIAAAAVVTAGGVTVLQWFAVDAEPILAFSGLIALDGLAVFARFALVAVTGFGLLTAWRYFEGLGRRAAEATALVLLATAGFSIMVAANNLVMMFLGLEVGSIALYVLAGMSRERARSDEAAIKYFLLGSFASAIFIYGVALLYAGTGSFELLGMRSFLADNILLSPAIVVIGLGLVIVGLGFKVSAAPFHTWAPDVYQGAPAGVVGYMAAVAKVAGFVAIARILSSGLTALGSSWLPVVSAIAAVSMVIGALFALVQGDVRRMLAYSGVAHAGFILTGVVGGTIGGVLFYLAIYSLQLVGAFAVVSAVGGPDGSESGVDTYRGLAGRSPMLAASFTVILLGMAGLPLTSGFIAKFGVFAGAWTGGYEWLVIVAVLASVVAFAFYLRIIVAMYMDDSDAGVVDVPGTVKWALGAAVGTTILWGILPGSLLDLAANALPL